MTRFLYLLIVSFTFSVHSYAQVDPKAQDILKGVSSKYRSYKSLSASFKVNILDQKTKKNEAQTGTLIIRGTQFNLGMNDQTVMCDGKTTWTFLKESNEVQISESKINSDAITPTNIFTMYEKGFKSKYLGEKKIAGKTVQQIELVPEDNKKNYIKIVLNIDKVGKFVSEATIYNKNGNIMTYSILKFTPNAVVTDDLFIFNKAKFPGVDVVDLR